MGSARMEAQRSAGVRQEDLALPPKSTFTYSDSSRCFSEDRLRTHENGTITDRNVLVHSTKCVVHLPHAWLGARCGSARVSRCHPPGWPELAAGWPSAQPHGSPGAQQLCQGPREMGK